MVDHDPIILTTQYQTSPSDVRLENIQPGQPDSRISTTESTALTKQDVFKLLTAGLSFLFSGANDGSLGALTPYVIRTYNVSTSYMALIYGCTFIGWVVCACTNSHISRYLPIGSVLALGAILQLIAQVLRVWQPPFGVFVTTFFIQALGMAYQDAHSNTFVAGVKGTAHRWLGFIHACYALGCLVGPFVVTGIATGDLKRWPLFYGFLIGLGVVNLCAVGAAFWEDLGLRRRIEDGGETQGSRSAAATKDIINTLKQPTVYLLSLFYFFYIGAAITAGGWVVEYLISARQGRLPSVGYVSAGLWGGVFLGRLLLAEPTYRFGERMMVGLYAVCMLAMQLVFWLVPSLVGGAVAMCIFGVFSGPLFATGMNVATRILRKDIQPTALGFIFVMAQAGGAIFPAITGVIARSVGVKIMQPILVGLIVAMGISWVLIPKERRRDE